MFSLAVFLLSHFAEVAKQFSKLGAVEAAIAVEAAVEAAAVQQCNSATVHCSRSSNSASLQWSDHNYSGNYSRGE